VSRNVTLTIDEDLLLAARKLALDRNTSVNAMVREYLEDVTSQAKRRAEARATLEKFFEEKPVRLGGITWTRDDLYDRKG
jgi:post-segregation antitoxin (ccd killing protein)